MYHKTPIIFVRTIISVQFLVQLTSQQSKMPQTQKPVHNKERAHLPLIKLTMPMALLAILNNKPQE
jgi:hypothetical protein